MTDATNRWIALLHGRFAGLRGGDRRMGASGGLRRAVTVGAR
jgi:hypothetical protein